MSVYFKGRITCSHISGKVIELIGEKQRKIDDFNETVERIKCLRYLKTRPETEQQNWQKKQNWKAILQSCTGVPKKSQGLCSWIFSCVFCCSRSTKNENSFTDTLYATDILAEIRKLETEVDATAPGVSNLKTEIQDLLEVISCPEIEQEKELRLLGYINLVPQPPAAASAALKLKPLPLPKPPSLKRRNSAGNLPAANFAQPSQKQPDRNKQQTSFQQGASQPHSYAQTQADPYSLAGLGSLFAEDPSNSFASASSPDPYAVPLSSHYSAHQPSAQPKQRRNRQNHTAAAEPASYHPDRFTPSAYSFMPTSAHYHPSAHYQTTEIPFQSKIVVLTDGVVRQLAKDFDERVFDRDRCVRQKYQNKPLLVGEDFLKAFQNYSEKDMNRIFNALPKDAQKWVALDMS